MTDYFRRQLGLPTREIMDELRYREEMIERITRAQQTITMAGAYEPGTRIKAKIIQWKSLNCFVFKTKILTKDQIRKMKTVMDYKYKDGSHMYSTRTLTSDLGQIKLMYDPKDKAVHRCRLEDLYTVNQGGRLKMLATVLLIDIGKRVQYIDFDNLYDAPQSINYYTEIEPEAKFARICLGETVPRDILDKSINQYCLKHLKVPFEDYTLEILGFKDDIYHVDFIDHQGKSFVRHLREKFHDKLKIHHGHIDCHQHETNCHGGGKKDYVFSELDVVRHLKSPKRSANRISAARGRVAKLGIVEPRSMRRCLGVVEYFRDKILDFNDLDESKSNLGKRLFGVRVICWDDPETFFILPDDPDYYSRHDEFAKDLEASLGISNDEPNLVNDYDRPYAKGELCLFKNESDYKLGKWLRGVIIEVPCTTTDGTVSLPGISDEKGYNKCPQTPINTSLKTAIDKYIYKVRSIDYGFQCIRSPPNLRHVQDERSFLRRSPWALRCRLFGIEPSEYEISSSGGYSSFCLEMIDSWMRAKTLDRRGNSSLSVLFRTTIVNSPNNWQSDDSKVNISLFHEHEPPYRLEESMMPRKRRSCYECLNWYLVERGLASDHIKSLKASSNIELDHYAVNLLVKHDRI